MILNDTLVIWLLDGYLERIKRDKKTTGNKKSI